ncbi:MAG: FHA domain-containing protein [Polyangiaceae bacterium]|nr:FHA domain-containing protein [Polyangiaceae bacterium]
MTADERGRNPSQSKTEEEAPPTEHREVPHFWLDYHGHEFDLRPGQLVLGRSAGCQIVLDDALVSRRHARIVVDEKEVVLEDLDSVNGVEVNGERVTGRRSLAAGDHIQVGRQELVLRTGKRKRDAVYRRLGAETLTGGEAAAILDEGNLRCEDPDQDSTHQGHTLELLGGLADKVLALKRGDEAERLLGPFLTNFIDQARDGRAVDPKMSDQVVGYALKIASVTGKPRWLDYTFELFTLLGRPLPAEAVDQLHMLLRTVRGISVNGLRFYVASLRAKQARMGPADRFLVQRIEGLERIATL